MKKLTKNDLFLIKREEELEKQQFYKAESELTESRFLINKIEYKLHYRDKFYKEREE